MSLFGLKCVYLNLNPFFFLWSIDLHLWKDGMHLLESGKIILANNFINSINNLSWCSAVCKGSSISSAFASENSISGDLSYKCINQVNILKHPDSDNVSTILKGVRLNNLNRIIIGNLNINSLPGKFEALKCIIAENIDILILTETKIDTTYPISQFMIEGYSKPYRLDRNKHGGGWL